MEKKIEGHKFRPLSFKEWLRRKVYLGDEVDGDDDDATDSTSDDDDDGGETESVLGNHVERKQEDDDNDCFKYDWLVGGWMDCRTLKDDSCGSGVQNRTVICVRLSDKVSVDDIKCRHLPPPHTRLCQHVCPQNCVIGQWSSWSQCPTDKCWNRQREVMRIRTRKVLLSNKNGGRECPSLAQVQPCEMRFCFEWKILDKGACQFGPGDAACGSRGNRSLSIECFNANGEAVAHKYCPLELRPSLWESCTTPCENDCIISDWSEWSSCDPSDFYDRAFRLVMHRSRYKEILSTSGEGGLQCTNLRLAVDKDRCPSPPIIYQWTTSNWSRCFLRTDERKIEINLMEVVDMEWKKCKNKGLQKREVHCVDSDGNRVSVKRCPIEHVPTSERTCSLDCRVDCVVSLFSDWSLCPVACLKEDTSELPQQIRRRFILDFPKNGGTSCPPLLESRSCLDLQKCSKLTWKVSAWSHCFFASPDISCGIGVRKREVTCIDLFTNERKPDNFCSSDQNFKPDWLEVCLVACNQKEPCLYSDWTEWSACSKRCNGIRWRYRTLEGTVQPTHPLHHHRHHTSCLSKLHPTVETQQCNKLCPSVSVKLIGQWSNCILNEFPTTSRANFDVDQSGIGKMRAADRYCGIGSRYHALVCSESDGDDDDDDTSKMDGDDNDTMKRDVEQRNKTYMAHYFCSSEGMREEMCFTSCKRDCQTSKWSQWSTCETRQRCGNGVKKRSRFILEASLDGGRACPVADSNQEEQSEPCHITCDQYQWLTGDWSICAPIGQSVIMKFQIGQCGDGIQTRSVRCVKIVSPGGRMDDTESSFCDSRLKPKEIAKCFIICHDQCAVSVWSVWSQCPHVCNHTTRHRSRHVIRNLFNKTCPPLEEQQACPNDEHTCDSYELTWSEWSRCMMAGHHDDDSKMCGEGWKVRYPECWVKSSRKVVAIEFCRRDPLLQAQLTEASSELCEIPCVVDCVVSEWLPWSPCSTSCNLGYRMRFRQILIDSENGGSLCPEVLVQNISCEYQECFRWMAVKFGECIIEENSCGFGNQLMEFKCLRLADDGDDDEEVDDDLCSYNHLPHVPLWQTCYVPCPSECLLSSWSSWSRCHVTCTKEHQPVLKYGLRSRSRFSIPGNPTSRSAAIFCNSAQLSESRTCLATVSACKENPSYEWHVTEWVKGERSVWCQDDHGNRVQGGCDSLKRPSPVRSCDSKCEVEIPFSRCLFSGRCKCMSGYEAVYSQNFGISQLVRCRPGFPTTSQQGALLHGAAPKPGYDAFDSFSYDNVTTKTDVWTYGIAGFGFFLIFMLGISICYVCRRSKSLGETVIVATSLVERCEVNSSTPQMSGMDLYHEVKSTAKCSFKDNPLATKRGGQVKEHLITDSY